MDHRLIDLRKRLEDWAEINIPTDIGIAFAMVNLGTSRTEIACGSNMSVPNSVQVLRKAASNLEQRS